MVKHRGQTCRQRQDHLRSVRGHLRFSSLQEAHSSCRMNEPHDVPDINLWADSVQAAVTAIRQAGYSRIMSSDTDNAHLFPDL